jgi:hypothetical protein
MRKILSIFILLFVLSFFSGIYAAIEEADSDVGVKFNDSTLQITLEQAQKENKEVMIDFYSPT